MKIGCVSFTNDILFYLRNREKLTFETEKNTRLFGQECLRFNNKSYHNRKHGDDNAESKELSLCYH